jgi:UDP-GlcNAc:undecaprenyl-phosphate GlcNAc-1-phosphate transferase
VVFTGLCAGLIFCPEAFKPIQGSFKNFTPVFLGGMAILVLNLFDDIKGLSSKFRFTTEAIIVLAVVLAGVSVSFLPKGFWKTPGEIIITVLWVVGIINAYNYLDGMDGLAGGSAVINNLFFALILLLTNQLALALVCLILAASCLGFLAHNFPKARMFLGDSGSTFLGFMIAGIGLVGTWAQDNIVKLFIPILILGVPIFDMIFTTITRTVEGKIHNITEWFAYAGRDHFHHYLTDLGLSPFSAVLFIWAVTVSLGISALLVCKDKSIEGYLTLLQASIIFVNIGVLIVVGKKNRHGE